MTRDLSFLCFLSQRGLCGVAQFWTLSEDRCANELSERFDGLHGPLHRTVCVFRDGGAAMDLHCYCWHFPIFVTGRNGKAALLKNEACNNIFLQANPTQVIHRMWQLDSQIHVWPFSLCI